jgi:phosphate acetyltransferase
MLTSKEAKIPNNLISVAKKTPGMTAGIVCADHDSSMDSAKKSVELDLIKPIFIGDKNAIKDKAEQIKWDLTTYEIIHSSDDKEAAMTGAELARDNKIKIMIKGNLHTDILMRTYLKKEFGLIEGKRLSHIWHMTLSENDKPLFITDGALNVSPRVDVKMHILKNVIDFAKRINISKPKVAILSGTEDPIESMPSSIEAREIMKI